MGLDQPLRSIGLADPHSDGVVVVVLPLGFVAGAAAEGVHGMVGSESGIRREDADLEIAKLVGLELAVLEIDQKGIDGLNMIVDFNEILREEAADSRKAAFSHGCPEMLLQIDDFDRSGARGLGKGRCCKSQQEKEGTHEAMVASALLLGEMFR